jgi:hypothetical protein
MVKAKAPPSEVDLPRPLERLREGTGEGLRVGGAGKALA